MTTAEILRDTKARLTPETWRKRHCEDPDNGCCLVNALSDAAGLSRASLRFLKLPAHSYLADAVGDDAVGFWNNEEGRTLEEVHAAIDRAIELAEAS